MKYKRLGILALIVLVALGLMLLLSIYAYQIWGRRVIYKANSRVSIYSGSGASTKSFDQRAVAIPNGDGRPVFISPQQKDTYTAKNYKVLTIPAQDELIYEVGTVARWEDINGSSDKYLIVMIPGTNNSMKFRVVFDSSYLFGVDRASSSVLFVEDTSIRWKDDMPNRVTRPKIANLSDIGFDKVQKIIRNGDSVVVTPAVFFPIMNLKDSGQVYLAGNIIIRRIGGVVEMDKEMQKLGVLR